VIGYVITACDAHLTVTAFVVMTTAEIDGVISDRRSGAPQADVNKMSWS